MNKWWHADEWDMAHRWMSHGTQMNESWHTDEWVMAHICMMHGTQMNESCHTDEWVMEHRWMTRGTQITESRIQNRMHTRVHVILKRKCTAGSSMHTCVHIQQKKVVHTQWAIFLYLKSHAHAYTQSCVCVIEIYIHASVHVAYKYMRMYFLHDTSVNVFGKVRSIRRNICNHKLNAYMRKCNLKINTLHAFM